jgi:competence protein ComFC
MQEANNNNVFQFFLKAKNGLSSIFYPNLCEICSVDLPVNQNKVCHYCLSNLRFTLFENYATDTPIQALFYGRVPLEFAYSMVYFKKQTAIQDVLHKIKYGHGHELARIMGEMMAKRLVNNDKFKDIQAFVPIPLHRKKEIIRGYNQSLKITEGLSKCANIPIVELLVRTKHHESQTKKDKHGRFENVEAIFALKEATPPPNHIALVDDVLTTGATLEAASRVIKKAFPDVKISVLTIAVAK